MPPPAPHRTGGRVLPKHSGAALCSAAVRPIVIIVSVVFTVACSDGDTTNTPDSSTPPTGTATLGAAGYQCVVRTSRAVLSSGPEGITMGAPWFSRGPSGLRAWTSAPSGELRWSDGRSDHAVPRDLKLFAGQFGWAGERFVAAPHTPSSNGFDLDFADADTREGLRLVAFDASMGDAHPLRTGVPANACNLRITELPGHVLLTWIRRGEEGCTGGEPFVQLLGARGEALTAPRKLTDDNSDDVSVQTLSARWDFGHVVLTGRGGRTYTWVLDTAGEVLRREFGGDIACLRNGCARVRIDSENSTGGGVGGSTLRFDPLFDGTAQHTQTYRVHVQLPAVSAMAVSGDRLLVLRAAEPSGCDLTVVDTMQHTVVSELHEEAMSACDDAHVRATPRGFALAAVDPTAGSVTRALDCTR